MTLFKCKMCGGTIEFEQGATVGICDSCGSKQTLPNLCDERRANMFDRANHFRRSGDFDKAEGIFESILAEDREDAEAYWSLVLCKYGISYVEDPKTHKQVPTVNRAQYTPVKNDENYLAAIKYADGYQRDIYKAEAEQIDRIQKGILEISGKEKPFDVFISYKDTDNLGQRTRDSVLAQDIYTALIKDGYKVFFSRITLENKLGSEYEPYIFAALNSAKVMLLVGTSRDNMNAVWVKNEWSRYLQLIKKDSSKVLIPVYADMSPYDMPDELSNLMAQDMTKIGFIQDLTRGIDKVLKKEEEKSAKETVIVGGGTDEISPLLKRAFMFLEDGNWSSANEYCEKILDKDPENARAYLGKLMAELQVKTQDKLKDCENPFDESNNYLKIMRFGDATLKKELTGYIKFINERNENTRKDSVYASAKAKMTGDDLSNYEDAIRTFKTIPGWRDVDKQIEICHKEIMAKEEAKRIATAKAEIKRKKIISVATPIIVACVVFIIVLSKVIIPYNNYNSALRLYNEGKYEEAITAFKELNGYKDSEAQIESCNTAIKDVNYDIAVELYKSGKYKEAITAFTVLDGYKDSKVQLENCYIGKFGEEKWNEIKNIKIGDTYTFGSYWQDNIGGKEPIQWIVLDKDGLSLLLISDKALARNPYKEYDDDIYVELKKGTWGSSTIRRWLNNSFLDDAFSAEEQLLIQSTNVSADKNPYYSTDPGNATTDKVFLLSITEAEKYFSSDNERKCVHTEHAGEKGSNIWWLRSPGRYQSYAAYVRGDDGTINYFGDTLNYAYGCIRPALWINLDS